MNKARIASALQPQRGGDNTAQGEAKRSPGVKRTRVQSPEGAKESYTPPRGQTNPPPLVPDIALVEFDLMASEEFAILLLKGLSSMMLFLMRDVLDHGWDIGLADG